MRHTLKREHFTPSHENSQTKISRVILYITSKTCPNLKAHLRGEQDRVVAKPGSWCLLIHFPTFFQMDTWDFELFHTTQFYTGASQLYLLSVFQAQIFSDIIFITKNLSVVHSLGAQNSGDRNKYQTYMFINLYHNIHYRAHFVYKKRTSGNIILQERSDFSCKDSIHNGNVTEKIS